MPSMLCLMRKGWETAAWMLCSIGKYWKTVAWVVLISLVVLVVVLAILAVPDAERGSVLAIMGLITVAAAVLSVLVWLDKGKGLPSGSRTVMRVVCWLVLVPAVSVYFLGVDPIEGISPALEFGVVAVAATLGGLVLNAGLSSGVSCESLRREFIAVAQKFIVVVILAIIFPPIMWYVDSAGGADLTSFEPSDASGWVLGALLLFGMFSFFAGVTFFIVALVDLVYAMMCLGKSSCGGKASGRDGSCEARTGADA